MISTVDVETSYQKTEQGGMDPLPFNPKNILVSVGINDEYYFTNHSERVDKGCYHKIQAILDQTTLLIGHNIKMIDTVDWTIQDIDSHCEKYKPDIIVIDQLDKINVSGTFARTD